jgi:glyoxylase-like metal-dependent hydrolase (beta-lactamase superfamily II)
MNIEKVDFNGYRIGIPVPFPMKYIYCYLFKEKDGYILIDAGFNYKPAKETWHEVFQKLKINPNEIKTIYLTHFHPDHSGLAGWMQQLTGATVYIHEIDIQMMERVFGKDSVQSKQMRQMVLNHGVPQKLSEEIAEHMDKITNHVLPLPTMLPIGEEVEFAERKWKVILIPGHSSGHIGFYQEDEKLLISGDHILDKITPNISLWPGGSQQPLHDYVDSLQKVRELGVQKVLPAHGNIIHRVNKRIDELIEHHEDRLSAMEELAKSRTAYQIAEDIFSHKDLTPHQWRFAIAETVAHLEYLTFEKRISKADIDPIVYARVNETVG